MTLPIERWVAPPTVTMTGPATLAVQGTDGHAVPVGVANIGPGRVDLHALWAAPVGVDAGALAFFARATTLSRTGLLHCNVEGDGIRIVAPLYADGASQQVFLAAATEVAKAWETLDASASAWRDEHADAQAAAQAVARIDAELAPTDQAVREFEARYAGQPASWTRTHVVPAAGMRAWPAPDPSSPATALAPGTELSLVERRGDWAQVSAANGWRGWVDARVLDQA